MNKGKVANIIRDIGAETHRRIKELPEKDRSFAWACVSSAILGAAVNSSDEPEKVMEMAGYTLKAMIASDCFSPEWRNSPERKEFSKKI